MTAILPFPETARIHEILDLETNRGFFLLGLKSVMWSENLMALAKSKTARLIAFALGALACLAFAYIGVSYLIFSFVERWVTARLWLDYYAAQLAATAIVIAMTAVLPILASYLLLGRKRLYGALSLIGIQAAIFVLVYSIGGNVCFDRRTGRPLCYYADTPKGRVWSYSPGFEPTTGRQFRLYTREIQEAEARRK